MFLALLEFCEDCVHSSFGAISQKPLRQAQACMEHLLQALEQAWCTGQPSSASLAAARCAKLGSWGILLVMQISTRAAFYLGAVLFFWGLLVLGFLIVPFPDIPSSPFRSLGVTLFDFLGALMMFLLSSNLPKTLRPSVLGLGVALFLIGLGDASLAYTFFTGIARETLLWLREPVYYTGSAVVALAALTFPFVMQRQGLFMGTQAVGLVLGSLGVSAILTTLFALTTQTSASFLVFLCVALFVTALFGGQALLLGSGKLARTLRQLSVVFVLSSLARVVVILLGNQPLGTVLYDLFWASGLSFAAYMMAVREKKLQEA